MLSRSVSWLWSWLYESTCVIRCIDLYTHVLISWFWCTVIKSIHFMETGWRVYGVILFLQLLVNLWLFQSKNLTKILERILKENVIEKGKLQNDEQYRPTVIFHTIQYTRLIRRLILSSGMMDSFLYVLFYNFCGWIGITFIVGRPVFLWHSKKWSYCGILKFK